MRSGYSDDLDPWDLIRWRGAVASAIRGRRGQAFLRELRDALDALPEPRLGADALQSTDGAVCALGSVGLRRGLDLSVIDPEDRHAVAHAFGIAEALAAEIMFENDEDFCSRREDSAARRFQRMRAWVTAHLAGPSPPESGTSPP